MELTLLSLALCVFGILYNDEPEQRNFKYCWIFLCGLNTGILILNLLEYV